MSNIEQLKREGLAARVTWHFGDEELPVKLTQQQADETMKRIADCIAEFKAVGV